MFKGVKETCHEEEGQVIRSRGTRRKRGKGKQEEQRACVPFNLKNNNNA